MGLTQVRWRPSGRATRPSGCLCEQIYPHTGKSVDSRIVRRDKQVAALTRCMTASPAELTPDL